MLLLTGRCGGGPRLGRRVRPYRSCTSFPSLHTIDLTAKQHQTYSLKIGAKHPYAQDVTPKIDHREYRKASTDAAQPQAGQRVAWPPDTVVRGIVTWMKVA